MSSAKNKPLKIVLDTNVYISALLFSGIPDEILEMAREKEIEIYASPIILLEIGQVLQKKFSFPRKTILNILKEIKRIAKIIQPKEKIDFIKADPADNRILECALAAKADYIVSGDKKHLRKLEKFQNIPIVLPVEFIKK